MFCFVIRALPHRYGLWECRHGDQRNTTIFSCHQLACSLKCLSGKSLQRGALSGPHEARALVFEPVTRTAGDGIPRME